MRGLVHPAPSTDREPTAPEEIAHGVTWWHLVTLVTLPALVFSNSLRNGYHLDDIYRVSQNLELERLWPPTRFFTDIRTGSTLSTIAEYRPLMPLTHSLDIHIADAIGISRLTMFHLSNIAIHVASTVVVYFLLLHLVTRWDPSVAKRLGRDTALVAFGAALIFGVHPIAGSSVNYIVGRDLLLMTMFLLSSMLVYVTMREQGESVTGWVLCLGLLWLAILSKQEAIIAFAFVLLFETVLARARWNEWRLWMRTGLVALPTAAYFALRALWITKQNPGDDLRYASGVEYPLTMMKAHLLYYGRNYVWPFRMRALASFPLVDTLAEPGVLLGLAVIVVTFAAAWWCRNRMPLASFAILSYWLFFALTSSIFPFRFVVTDYRQYVPLAFISLATVLAVSMVRARRVAIALIGVFVAYSAVSSFAINTHWRTEESFWHQSVRFGGRALAHNNYALAIAGRDPDLAEFHYLEALRQEPFNIYPNINLGMLYVREGRSEEGLALLRATETRNPGSALASYWLSKGLGIAGLPDEQLAAAMRAAEYDAGALYQYEVGSLLHLAGQTAASIPYLERVVATSPGYEEALFMLAFAHGELGERDLAISEYQRYLSIHPDHVQSHFNLGYELSGRGECPAAIEQFETVLELRPTYAAAHFQLAKCYRALGDEAAAQEQDALYEAGS